MVAPSATRREAYRAAVIAVNTPKHALMRIVSDLKFKGANAKAASLENLVRRLEEWQHK